jgi:hypothetical protein
VSTTARARQLELEAAEHRVVERLKPRDSARSTPRRVIVLVAAALLFAAAFAARIVINDPDALLANFYVVPIALLAIEFGVRGGVIGATIGFALVPAWSLINTVHVNALGYISRGAVMYVTGVVVGRFSDRLRSDIAERQGAQRDLTLYADQLEGSIRGLARSVERLEAFAEIARAVGGETELQRVLALIVDHGRGIVGARTLVVYLPEGSELVAASGSAPDGEPPPRLPVGGSLAGNVLTRGLPLRVDAQDEAHRLEQLAPDAKAAILVPLVFRGEKLGVLAAINGPGTGASRARTSSC